MKSFATVANVNITSSLKNHLSIYVFLGGGGSITIKELHRKRQIARRTIPTMSNSAAHRASLPSEGSSATTPADDGRQYVNVSIAPGALAGVGGSASGDRHSVHVVVEKPKVPLSRPAVVSYCFDGFVNVMGAPVPQQDLLALLWERSDLARTASTVVTDAYVTRSDGFDCVRADDPALAGCAEAILLAEEKEHDVVLEQSLDYTPPQMSGMPRMWPFSWNGVQCTVNRSTLARTHLHVHTTDRSVADGVVRSVLFGLFAKRVPRSAFKGTVRVYGSQDSPHVQWRELSERAERDMDTIYLSEAIKNDLISRVERFRANKDMYAEYGVPWKFVCLLDGPPGTGKSSLAFAMASRNKSHIAKLTLTPRMTAASVETLFATVPTNAFVLLEDADALFSGRVATEGSNLDFSTLLNCLDGVAVRSGLVVFMTTNDASCMDSAFVRPGRVDHRVTTTLPDRACLAMALRRLGARWAAEHEAFLDAIEPLGLTIASLQRYLFDCKQLDRTRILDDVNEL